MKNPHDILRPWGVVRVLVGEQWTQEAQDGEIIATFSQSRDASTYARGQVRRTLPEARLEVWELFENPKFEPSGKKYPFRYECYGYPQPTTP